MIYYIINKVKNDRYGIDLCTLKKVDYITLKK